MPMPPRMRPPRRHRRFSHRSLVARPAHQVEEGIEIRGRRINKPFVEKPVDSEDHRVHVYYPDSVGGGSKRLFRKVADQSSQFYPGVNTLRTDGAYIYEEFLPTEGTDVKVFICGFYAANA